MIERIRALAIPPAWKEVWICSDPLGHLQATGTDAAGRKQYLYHESWRTKRDSEKFRRMLRFAQVLPRLRRRVESDLEGDALTRERVLAGAARLLDLGLFRIGSEQYAENGGGLGLATIRKEHVKLNGDAMVFDYPAKSGVRRTHMIDDRLCAELVAKLKHRRGGEPALLAYREGRRWVGVRSADVNEYLKLQLGEDFSAKDFRTWNATVLAAVSLAAWADEGGTKASRQRAVDRAVRDVAQALGNTPAVARSAYIDPQVFDRYRSGWTIASPVHGRFAFDAIEEKTRRRVERAVLDLLDGDRKSSAVRRVTG